MLCNAIHVAVFLSIGIAHVTVLLQCPASVESSLPPGVEDEIILIEHLPGYRVHLQDFFWTGAENGPRWSNPEQKLTMIETKTIYRTSTVYINDQDNGLNVTSVTHPQTESPTPSCPQCIDPTPTLDEVDQNIGIFLGDDPGPRYWLLTVLRAGEIVPSNVELRLARLYRTAFNRQQHRHLGLGADLYGRRQRLRRTVIRQIVSTKNKRDSADDVEVLQDVTDTLSNISVPVKMQFIDVPKDEISLIINPESPETQIRPFEEHEDTDTPSTVGFVEEISVPKLKSDARGQNVSHSKNGTSKTPVNPNLVQVSMQNVSVMEDMGTKLIYSVHLGGKPVPAETAARDMALLSPQEVALELGAPVIIQSQPYLRETRPLALSRKRDAWLFIGAAAAAVLMLTVVIITLALVAKRKRAHSVVLPPPPSILKRDKDNSLTQPGGDNTVYTSETEARTDGTSQRRTPMSYSRTPVTLGTPDTLDDGIRDISSDDEDNQKKRSSTPWEILHYPEIARNIRRKKMARRKTIEYPKTPDSTDSIGDQIQTLDSLEKGFSREEEAPTSPHSYLSMPSCKQFPDMAAVEPLSRVKHLDIEEYDSPDMNLRRRDEEYVLTRVASATHDPGVIGPIVWDLHKRNMAEGSKAEAQVDVDFQRIPFESVGRARRRLHELLEDSFNLFSSKEIKQATPKQTTLSLSSEHLTSNGNIRGKIHIKSPSISSTSDKSLRPLVPVARRVDSATTIEETGNLTIQPRGAWAARPMSAGPFHRPCLPEHSSQTQPTNNASRIAARDPAVPLIAAISKELEQFTID